MFHAVPSKSVSNVVAEFEDSNSVKVSWVPLTFWEAKGFPLYIIRYTSDDGSITGSVNTTNSSVTIEGLNPQLAFTFTVQITTGNGHNVGPSTTSKKCYRVHMQGSREQLSVFITLLQLYISFHCTKFKYIIIQICNSSPWQQHLVKEEHQQINQQ